MAVETVGSKPVAGVSTAGRRFLVGTNVFVATVLTIAVVVVAQLIAYKLPKRWDMTSSGVNSLSDGTENLLRNLDSDIRLTALYFETDREEADQPRYRRAVQDLLDLYQITNRGRVRAEWINPLKDHEKFQTLIARLRDKTGFKDEIGTCRGRIEAYKGELDAKLRALVQAELDRITAMGGAIEEPATQAIIGPVEQALAQLRRMLEKMRERIDELTLEDNPQYGAAINELKNLYGDVGKLLKEIGKYGAEQASRNAGLATNQAEFLRETRNRYAEVVTAVEQETTKLQDLKPLKLDEVLAKLGPTTNPVLVETDSDALVVDFMSVWPPLDQGAGPRAGFKERAFKGEEKLTSAILRATHKEQTAVVFVHYGGGPLFLGGFMPNQPPAPYAAMKQQLEDTNFVVEEWDVKSSQTPPKIEPTPTRTVYIVLKPTPPQRGPTGQPSQEPPFADSHRRAVLDVIKQSGRALFIAGWQPGPFGPMPSTYEFGEYLTDEWGITVDTSALLVETVNFAPGRYAVGRRDFFNMGQLNVTDHDIVGTPTARQLAFPMCAPLDLSESPPDGVVVQRLVYMPRRDGVWGVKNLMKYQEQQQQREYLTKEPDDLEGPFDLAAAATKGDAKTVVVSSADFAEDNVAFAREFATTAQGFTIRSRNPGNVVLLVNSLHWLNDNTEFMNIGKPIDAAVLQIGPESTVRAVQVLTIFVWPMFALVCGGIAWWIRRR
jgi:hypothetical protein